MTQRMGQGRALVDLGRVRAGKPFTAWILLYSGGMQECVSYNNNAAFTQQLCSGSVGSGRCLFLPPAYTSLQHPAVLPLSVACWAQQYLWRMIAVYSTGEARTSKGERKHLLWYTGRGMTNIWGTVLSSSWFFPICCYKESFKRPTCNLHSFSHDNIRTIPIFCTLMHRGCQNITL